MSSAPPDPLFVGGTGRSGTHVLARLVGRNPRYRNIPIESRFHADPPGLPGLLAGKTSLQGFLGQLRGEWWYRMYPDGQPRGLSRCVAEEVFGPAVTEFEQAYPEDPVGSSARLVRTLLDPIAEKDGKPSWVEMTNRNIEAAPTLLKLFPDMKAMHILRDGRDVAASVTAKFFGPKSIATALKWWEERLVASERGAAAIPADRLLVMGFEDLVVADRDRSFARLVDFMGVPEGPRMSRFFGRRMTAEHANTGRWREGLSQTRQHRLTTRYAKALERLIALDSPGRQYFERELDAVGD